MCVGGGGGGGGAQTKCKLYSGLGRHAMLLNAQILGALFAKQNLT